MRNYLIISAVVVAIINPLSTGLLQDNYDYFETYLQPLVDLSLKDDGLSDDFDSNSVGKALDSAKMGLIED